MYTASNENRWRADKNRAASRDSNLSICTSIHLQNRSLYIIDIFSFFLCWSDSSKLIRMKPVDSERPPAGRKEGRKEIYDIYQDAFLKFKAYNVGLCLRSVMIIILICVSYALISLALELYKQPAAHVGDDDV